MPLRCFSNGKVFVKVYTHIGDKELFSKLKTKKNYKCEPDSTMGLTGVLYQCISTTITLCLRLFPLEVISFVRLRDE